MKHTLLIIALFTPLLMFGQESASEMNRLSIGVNYSPNYSYRTLDYSSDWEYFVYQREQTESPTFGYNTGLAIQFTPVKKLELELAFQIARHSLMHKNILLTDYNGNPLGNGSVQDRFYFLEIPLFFHYRIIDKKFFCYITAAASVNLFLFENTKSWLKHHRGETKVIISETNTQDLNEIGYSLIGGLGIGYHFDEKMNIRLAPLFRHSLTPIAAAPIKQYHYSIGCQIGLNFVLK